MIRLFKRIIVAALAVATLSCLASCSQWDTPYETHGKDGYNVSVRFDVGDGQFAEVNDVYIVDMFKYEDFEQNENGCYEIPIVAPNDSSVRGKNALRASRTGYFLAGWYSERELRFDGQGNMLDDFGNVTTDPEAQGYIYSGLWDFANDTLEVDPAKNPSAETEYLTLYAAWVPYYSFETYVEGESTPYDVTAGLSLNLPAWKNGAMNMNSFPAREGYTFDGAYSDPECTVPYTGEIEGVVDYATGTSLTPTVKVYTKWREGNWIRVEAPEHFTGNISASNNYELFCDVDYTNKTWPKAFSGGTFTGTIIGNGHKITGITVNQTNTNDTQGGMFRVIGSTASLSDITFENVTYNLMSGTIRPSASFGAFTSEIEDGATLSGVSFSGTLNIGYKRGFTVKSDTQIGLVTPLGTHSAISGEVKCYFIKGEADPAPAESLDGFLNADGTVNVSVLSELNKNS